GENREAACRTEAKVGVRVGVRLEFAALDAGGEQPAVDDLPGAVDARVVGQDHPHRAKEGLAQIEPPEPRGELDLIGCDWVALEPRQRAPLRARYEPARHTVRRRAAVRGAEHERAVDSVPV